MPKTTKAATLHELLLNKLMVLYDVEIQITKALPQMAKKASDSGLRKGFADHLKETETHVKRLEQCFTTLAVKPKKLTSEAIRGLVDDAKWVMQNVQAGPALDANLIAAAQYVEHYEMAGYGSAIEWARVMGHGRVADVLQETLDEEILADEKLNDLAISRINMQVPTGIA